jgi:hypothetical protein
VQAEFTEKNKGKKLCVLREARKAHVRSAVSHRRAIGVRGTNGVVNDSEAHEISHFPYLWRDAAFLFCGKTEPCLTNL